MNVKKMIAVTAASLCAAVTFAEGIESQNVVGYQTKSISAGFSLSTPTFLDVGQEGMDLQNFKLGANAAGDGTEMIQFLDDEGINTQIWIWLNANMGMEEGWYDFNTWEPITETIVPSAGFLMNVSASVDMLIAGQVKSDKTTVTLPAGFSVVGNNTPNNIDIQSLKLGEAAAGDGTEMIQFLDNEGINTQIWIWLNANMGMEEGWYDFNTWEPIEYTVKAGEAFLINVAADVEMTIPSAL